MSEVPARLVDEAGDALHFPVVNFLGAVESGVVIGVQAGVEEHGRNMALEKRPLVAAAQEVGSRAGASRTLIDSSLGTGVSTRWPNPKM